MKWTKEYHGCESIMDFDEDWLDIALSAVVPNGEFDGSVKITFEYIPPEGEESPLDELATLRAQLAEAKKEPQLRCNHCDRILTATWKTDSGGRFAWVDKCKFCEVTTA